MFVLLPSSYSVNVTRDWNSVNIKTFMNTATKNLVLSLRFFAASLSSSEISLFGIQGNLGNRRRRWCIAWKTQRMYRAINKQSRSTPMRANRAANKVGPRLKGEIFINSRKFVLHGFGRLKSAFGTYFNYRHWAWRLWRSWLIAGSVSAVDGSETAVKI